MNLPKAFALLLYITLPFVLYSQEVQKDVLLKDIRFLSSPQLEGRKPFTQGNLQAREYIKHRFDSLGLSSQFREYTQFFNIPEQGPEKPGGQGANVVGFIPGQESSKIIVITAHFDHLGIVDGKIFHGADDNASGTAGLLALAAYFSRNPPRHSLMFAALDAEEMGLQGARALLRDFPFPLEQILMNVNLDMISRSEKNELYAVGTRHYPHLKPTLERVARKAKIDLAFGHDEPGTGADDWTNASDHGPFHAEGIPFIYFGVEDHPDYHRPTDMYENIDPDFYFQAVNLILWSVIAFDGQDL
ncbi:MAG TPA: M28 family peptidase [Cyclobacteriaceae bacterium]|nr:M28 family peptidase [Cyclobacteriaceae bacterium]